MTLEEQAWKKKRRRLWLGIALLIVLLAIVFMPPLVSMNSYKTRITGLIADSFGRPVRLSSVELRLLPTPGFVLTDLTVQEDPAYGAEPVLHANAVTASIRLLALLKGRVEIGTVSVDEASLNVVRTADGRWNLDPLFRTAAAKAAPGAHPGAPPDKAPTALPYLEATNSRINFKRGAEKLPFSLVETDLSFWQEQPGDWRVRLRGQPARTDVNLDLADTGLVRLEARAQRLAGTGQLPLRKMPLHVDVEWREAQLGQLARLVIGSDPGWRGDLTGEMHVDGTAEAAQIKTRLRATGVHRAEFAPAAPMDFDASCSGTYRYPAGALDGLLCYSPLGDGRIKLTGALPGAGSGAVESGPQPASPTPAGPHLTVELDKIPVAAGLDALRTVRSGIDASLVASGTVSGRIDYAPLGPYVVVDKINVGAPGPSLSATAETSDLKSSLPISHKPIGPRGNTAIKSHASPPGPLTGSLLVDGFQLSGDGLTTPVQATKLVLEPALSVSSNQAEPRGHAALEASMTLPAGGASALTVTTRFARAGYQLEIHGSASVARAKELAKVAGVANTATLDTLTGDAATVDLSASGPWLPPASAVPAGPDVLQGTVALKNAIWKASYLANPIEIAQATLHLGQGGLLWDPVVFTYGPVKGTATLTAPSPCEATAVCTQPRFQVQFSQLNAADLQSALLGAHEPGTLLSSLIARLKPTDKSAPAWPQMQGIIKADAFLLGPVTLTAATAALHIDSNGAEITSLDAGFLGGQVHGSGSVSIAQLKPAYAFNGHAAKLNPAQVGKLVGLPLSGKSLDASGKLQLSGFSAEDLASSATGEFHFDVERGALAGSTNLAVPAALSRFDHWSGDGVIADGAITLENTQARQGTHSNPRSVDLRLTLAPATKLTFPPATAVPAITP